MLEKIYGSMPFLFQGKLVFELKFMLHKCYKNLFYVLILECQG